MNLSSKEKLQKDYLLLQKQLFWLELSYKEVKKIKLQKTYEVNEYTAFETLVSRYIKNIDFLLQNSFISLDNYEFKIQYSQNELIKNAICRKIIDTEDSFRDLFSLRTKLLNEYILDNVVNSFEELYFNTKILIIVINNTLDYINKLIR